MPSDTLDSRIDELYQLPLSEFTAARNALAKSLKGADAAQVKRLQKPTVVPWAINQLYWRERKTFDRLMASGRALRAAQIAALKGKAADLRAAAVEHRKVLSDAVATATQLAAGADSHPQADPLSRMLEALSLASETAEQPGRFTDIIQPAGFEALAGVTPAAVPRPAPASHAESPAAATPSPRARKTDQQKGQSAAESAAAERRKAEQAAAERKKAQAAVDAAERQLDRARAAKTRAEAHASAIRRQLEQAEQAVAAADKEVSAADRELARARDALRER